MSKRDWWWVEVKWTRRHYEDCELEVVAEAWKKVEALRKVINGIQEWRLKLGERRVYGPQKLGVLVVSRPRWKLQLKGGGMEFRGDFGGGGGSSGSGSGGGEGQACRRAGVAVKV